MGASRIATFKMVKLPSAMPVFFSGLKISASYSIMAAVIGEWLGANRGLGYYMTISQKSFRVDQVLSAVVVIAIVSLLMVKVIDLAEWLLVPWNRNNQELDR
jgi:ABC-type nitrate/sulfonate/bicarbonate transport system permease component